MSDVFLKVTGIKKSFGGVKALKGVDLTISRGEVRCLAGENGCGKSTLIKVISGAHDADEGEIYIDGKTYTSHDSHGCDTAWRTGYLPGFRRFSQHDSR
jgi:simple sugar transport system ATP-binding protein